MSNGQFDVQETETFLKTLDPDASEYKFQTFDDVTYRNRKFLKEYFTGTLHGCEEKLKRRNRKGAGIFVTVNKVKKGMPRKNNYIERIRAVFVDLDGPEMDTIVEVVELEPSMIVESSPGHFHVYWLVQPGLSKEQFRTIQRSFSDRFSTDSVCDPARVMRLPGFLHMKNPEKPFRTKIVEINDSERYETDLILDAFYEQEEEQQQPKTSSTGTEAVLLDMISTEFPGDYGIHESDQEIIERARQAENGEKFSMLFDEGDTSEYPSHSEADLALVRLIAFWTGPRPNRIDKLFRQSALIRPKWDKERGSVTYGQRTILKALMKMDPNDFHQGDVGIDRSKLPDLPEE